MALITQREINERKVKERKKEKQTRFLNKLPNKKEKIKKEIYKERKKREIYTIFLNINNKSYEIINIYFINKIYSDFFWKGIQNIKKSSSLSASNEDAGAIQRLMLYFLTIP